MMESLFDKKIIRLDKNWKKGGDESFLSSAVNNYNPDIEINKEDFKIDINRVLSQLKEKELKVIKYYFGLEDRELSLYEISDFIGLTYERTRQILDKAIRRLKHSSRSKILRKYLG